MTDTLFAKTTRSRITTRRGFYPSNAKRPISDDGHKQDRQWDALMAAMRASTVKASEATYSDADWARQAEVRKASGATYDLGVGERPSESTAVPLHAMKTRSNQL